jgi:16S rRNA G966 N2-methylase RsmD
MIKNYSKAPLPFQGQKRRFIQIFKKYLERFSEEKIFVDLFGGSGLLSHTAKQVQPNNRVIWNDYDNYSKRLASIERTNKILDELRKALKDYPKDKRIVGETREKVIEILSHVNKGFVDWITLSSSLMFSMNYGKTIDDFQKSTLYNCIRQSDYDAAEYLKGVEVVSMDYKELYNTYKDNANVVFIVDPPYLSTDSSSYNSDGYWKLKDYLEVLNVITNQNYFYFTSDKSQIVELCEWISSVSSVANPFADAKRINVSTTVNYSSKYTDIMYYCNKD